VAAARGTKQRHVLAAHSSRLLSICSTTPANVRTPSGSITVK
jgi:hypothetical protein